jgi:hypothetical protein
MKKIMIFSMILAVGTAVFCGCGDSSSVSSSETSETSEIEYMRVGAECYGFIDIPDTWDVYTDEEITEANLLQYSDSDGSSIVTMKYYDDDDDMDAQQYALNMWSLLEDSIDDLTSTIVELDGTKAYQLSGYMDDAGKAMVCWLLDGSDGYTHVLTIETAEFNLLQICETYSISE